MALMGFKMPRVPAKADDWNSYTIRQSGAGSKEEQVSVPASTVGLPENKGGYSLNDLWTGETKKTGSTISAVVPSHGVVLYRVTRH